MGVDISGFLFRGLVLGTNFSVSLDTVESEGLTEGVLISCTSSKLSACESTNSCLFGVEADYDERRSQRRGDIILGRNFRSIWIELLERNSKKETL